ATSFTYTGKAIKPTVTVKDSSGKVVDSKYYTVSYKNNTNVGKATVTITFKGNYTGTKTLSFTIVPKQVIGLKVSSVKTTSLTLSWSKVTGAKYYKVEQSTDGKKWKTVATVSKNTATIKSLKAGTKYQFRVTALDSTKKVAGKSSAVLKTATLTGAPSVTLKSSKSKTATASWKKVTGASKYVVYKSTDGKKWTKVTTTTKTTYTFTKLTGGKKIYVKVTALNAYGKASASSTVKNVTVKK
ncbi:MAG: fibronectin type III domain-containing protein, partial [Oscillospiraceae bacterium]